MYVFPGTNGDQGLCATSLEGTSYALSWTSHAVPLTHGWTAATPRAVEMRVSGGVVRFEGSISGGTSSTIATLPPSFRPSSTVRVVGAAQSGEEARIVIEPSGQMRVTAAPPSVYSAYTSLDGVSYGF